MPSITVYVPASDARALDSEEGDHAEWIRKIVKLALAERRKARADG